MGMVFSKNSGHAPIDLSSFPKGNVAPPGRVPERSLRGSLIEARSQPFMERRAGFDQAVTADRR